jgi:hypothetical protein
MDNLSDIQKTWSEECCQCGVLLGGKVFTNEDEFDEHPDRDCGYDEDGQWYCIICRTNGDNSDIEDDGDNENPADCVTDDEHYENDDIGHDVDPDDAQSMYTCSTSG